MLAGRFAEAEEQAAQGLAIGRRAGDQAVELVYPSVVAALRWMQGRFGEMVELLGDLAARFPAAPVYQTCLALALAEAGRLVEAQAELERLTADDLAAVPRGLYVERQPGRAGAGLPPPRRHHPRRQGV
jgi:predicted Zn-dependent protease